MSRVDSRDAGPESRPAALSAHACSRQSVALPSARQWQEPVPEALSLRADHQAVAWRKQQQQDGRVAGDRETEPLSKAVGDEVEIAWPRARTFGLSALNVMLEGAPRVTGLGEPKPNQELRRLEEDRHLVSIVLVTLVQTVNCRAHGAAKDRRSLDQRSLLVTGHALTLPAAAAETVSVPYTSHTRASSSERPSACLTNKRTLVRFQPRPSAWS